MTLYIQKIKASISLFIILLFNLCIYAQIPPHPALFDKVKNGKIAPPKIIQNTDLIRNGTLHKNTMQEQKRENLTFSGDFNLLVVLVDFSDKPHTANADYYDSLIFSDTRSSVRKYFNEISYGKFRINTINLPSKTGWIRAPQTYSYYTSGGGYGSASYPNNTQKLAEDIVSIIDTLVDFSKYDNNNDGYADNIIIIHSGQGAEFTGNSSDIWSYSSSMGNIITRDNVSIYKYIMLPEYYIDNHGDLSIGPVAHEMGHSLFGLPEMYDPDYTSFGLGNWSLMAYGCWNGETKAGGDKPSHPDAYSKVKMGFAVPKLLQANTMNMEIKPAERDTAQIYKVWKDNDFSKGEYFLIENRRKLGFDELLPGEGLIVYHIDESKIGNQLEWYPGNRSSGNYLVSIVPADNKWELERKINRGDDGDPFPGKTGNTNFNLLTAPASQSYSSADSKAAIQNIRTAGQSIIADFYYTTYGQYIAISQPPDSRRLLSGDTLKIQWYSYMVSRINIEYNVNFGSRWLPVAMNYDASLGEYKWIVPDYKLAYCRIRITDASYPSMNRYTGSLIIENKVNKAKAPEPGDIIFTQFLAGRAFPFPAYLGLFEFVTLKDLNLSTLSFTDSPIQTDGKLPTNGQFPGGNITYELSRDINLFMEFVPKGTIVRYRLNGSTDIFTDTTGKIITIYTVRSNAAPSPYVIGNNVIAFTGWELEPVYIAGIALNNYWLNTSGGKKPDTPSDILLPWGTGGLFRDSVSGSPEFIRTSMLNLNNWKSTNNYDFVDKNITVLDSTSSVEQKENHAPVFTLQQNFPNPFNPTTTISYSISGQSFVQLKIYDMLGREVTTLINKEQSAGEYKVQFDGSSLSSGVYIYTIQAGQFRDSKKLIILK